MLYICMSSLMSNFSLSLHFCMKNYIYRYPNLIDGHEYDDGYETGVGDLMSHKYKLPSLPPPSSSPYSSLSSSSSSQQQQQSPSYNMGGGNSGTNMSHYQQQQYLQNQAQYPQAMQHQNHMNSFNYHNPFGRNHPQQAQQAQQQQMSNVIKNESENDPYRFVDDDLSNGMNYHPNAQQQHMSSPANYSPASSSPHMPSHMQQPQGGNASMMQQQYNEHHMSSPHHMHGIVNHMGSHPQQIQSQAQQHMINGGQSVGAMPGGMNSTNTSSSAMMMMNDTPKKRGRKKKMRDENG